MLKRLRHYWNTAPMFWKTYCMAVLFVGGIVSAGEGLESVLSMVFGGESSLSDTDEVWVWIAATFIPTAFGAYWLTRCFLRPLDPVSYVIAQLAEGRLQARITTAEVLRGDELGALARLLNHMAERLEHAMESERNLLAAISHELRSPLTRLSLGVELLRRHNTGAAAETHLQRLELEAERMNDLISQLLDYARREMTPQSREKVDLRALVADVAADAVFEGANRGTEVTLHLPDAAELYGNALLLRQAVDNVVRNALRYSSLAEAAGVTGPSTSTVDIALNPVAGGYCLTVRDHGPGVPDPMLDDIFKPFFRVNADRDRASGGAGMGLCLVEQAVRLHNGTVRAENVQSDDDGGLLVSITLPKGDAGV